MNFHRRRRDAGQSRALMEKTGAREFHASAPVPAKPFRGARTPAAAGFDFGPQRVTSVAIVRQLKAILQEHSTNTSQSQ